MADQEKKKKQKNLPFTATGFSGVFIAAKSASRFALCPFIEFRCGSLSVSGCDLIPTAPSGARAPNVSINTQLLLSWMSSTYLLIVLQWDLASRWAWSRFLETIHEVLNLGGFRTLATSLLIGETDHKRCSKRSLVRKLTRLVRVRTILKAFRDDTSIQWHHRRSFCWRCFLLVREWSSIPSENFLQIEKYLWSQQKQIW